MPSLPSECWNGNHATNQVCNAGLVLIFRNSVRLPCWQATRVPLDKVYACVVLGPVHLLHVGFCNLCTSFLISFYDVCHYRINSVTLKPESLLTPTTVAVACVDLIGCDCMHGFHWLVMNAAGSGGIHRYIVAYIVTCCNLACQYIWPVHPMQNICTSVCMW